MTDFLINAIIDPKGVKPGARKVKQELKGLEGSAEKLGKEIKKALTFGAVVLGIRKLGQLSDTYTNISNRLRTVTSDTEQLSEVTDELFDIAQRTRGQFEGTAEVYAKVGLAAKDLGRSQEELLAFTESLNQAVVLSGASAAGAAGGIQQLSQGLASGALRGDELNSVLENLPVVADVIAQSLGVTRGELRALGQEGKISADIVLDAFKEARVELTDRFGEAVPTLGQAFTTLDNSLLQFVGSANEAIGLTAGLADLVILAAENTDVLAGGVFVLAAAIASSYVPAGISMVGVTVAIDVALKKMIASTAFATASFAAIGVVAAVAANRGAEAWKELQEEILATTEAGEKFALTDYGKVGADIQRVQKNLANVLDQIDKDVTTKGFANPVALQLAERYRQQLADLGAEQELLADGTADTTVKARELLAAREALAGSVTSAIADIQQENELLALGSRERQVQAELLKQIAELEDGSDESVTDAQRAELELAIQRNQVLRDQAAAFDSIRGPQEQFNAQVAALTALEEEGRISSEELAAALRALGEEADGVNAAELSEGVRQLLAANGAAVQSTDALANAERRRQEILDDIASRNEQQKQDLADLKALYDANAISAATYNQELQNLGVQTDAMNTAQAGFASGMEEAHRRMTDVRGAAEDLAINGFQRAEDALVEFALTGKFEFNKFAEQVLADITRLIIKQALLSAIGGPSGGLFGGPRADGGPVNPDQSFLVGEEGPELFSPDTGGSIIPAGETAAMLGQGNDNPAPVVNVTSPPVNIQNFVEGESPEDFEDGVINVIQKNPRVIQGA